MPEGPHALVINSDDFGHNRRVNRAIVLAFKKGLCSSTTVMPNMPGFQEAVQFAHEHGLVAAVGIHVVLSEGTPLTDPIRKCARLCNENGRLRHLPGAGYRNLTRAERNAVRVEIHTQIDRCRAHGLPLTHLDSHHHVHHSWGDLSHVFVEAAQQKGIPFIRPRLFRLGVPWYRRGATLFYNARLRRRRLLGTDYCIDLRTYVRVRDTLNGWHSGHALEIAIHPTLGEDGCLQDAVDCQPLLPWVSQVSHHRSAMSYAQIRPLARAGTR